MDVAVLGATGDVGRQVCTQLVERMLLPTTSRLQLVGRPDGPSAKATHGLRADLIDAYDEHAPIIDVALDPADVVADLVVVAAGRTHPPEGGSGDRAALAADNAAVFRSYADALAEHGSGSEVVIVVTNPVELGVAILADRLGSQRVIGMGAWLDTLRFRREVAVSLGVRRQRVGGFVGGEHGPGAVPLWSSVRVGGLEVSERERAVARVRGPRSLDDFPGEVVAAQRRLATLGVAEGYRWVDTLPPDLRVVLRPYLTHASGAKTAAGTANATIDLLDTILDGRDVVVAGQVALHGEVSLGGEPVRGVLGVPVQLGPEGWTRVLLDEPAPDEEHRLAEVAAGVAAALAPWTARRDAGA